MPRRWWFSTLTLHALILLQCVSAIVVTVPDTRSLDFTYVISDFTGPKPWFVQVFSKRNVPTRGQCDRLSQPIEFGGITTSVLPNVSALHVIASDDTLYTMVRRQKCMWTDAGHMDSFSNGTLTVKSWAPFGVVPFAVEFNITDKVQLDDTNVVAYTGATTDMVCKWNTCFARNLAGAIVAWGHPRGFTTLGAVPTNNTQLFRPRAVMNRQTPKLVIQPGAVYSCMQNPDGIECAGYGRECVFPENAQHAAFAPLLLDAGDVAADRRIAVGFDHACAYAPADNGTITCWGNNRFRQVDGATTNHGPFCYSDRLSITLPKDTTYDVEAGSQFTCAVQSGRKATCWGDFAKFMGRDYVWTVDPIGLGIIENADWYPIALFSGESSVCFVNNRPTAWSKLVCVGDNTRGNIDVSLSSTGSIWMTDVVDELINVNLGGGFAGMAMSNAFTCVLGRSGVVACIGAAHYRNWEEAARFPDATHLGATDARLFTTSKHQIMAWGADTSSSDFLDINDLNAETRAWGATPAPIFDWPQCGITMQTRILVACTAGRTHDLRHHDIAGIVVFNTINTTLMLGNNPRLTHIPRLMAPLVLNLNMTFPSTDIVKVTTCGNNVVVEYVSVNNSAVTVSTVLNSVVTETNCLQSPCFVHMPAGARLAAFSSSTPSTRLEFSEFTPDIDDSSVVFTNDTVAPSGVCAPFAELQITNDGVCARINNTCIVNVLASPRQRIMAAAGTRAVHSTDELSLAFNSSIVLQQLNTVNFGETADIVANISGQAVWSSVSLPLPTILDVSYQNDSLVVRLNTRTATARVATVIIDDVDTDFRVFSSDHIRMNASKTKLSSVQNVRLTFRDSGVIVTHDADIVTSPFILNSPPILYANGTFVVTTTAITQQQFYSNDTICPSQCAGTRCVVDCSIAMPTASITVAWGDGNVDSMTVPPHRTLFKFRSALIINRRAVTSISSDDVVTEARCVAGMSLSPTASSEWLVVDVNSGCVDEFAYVESAACVANVVDGDTHFSVTPAAVVPNVAFEVQVTTAPGTTAEVLEYGGSVCVSGTCNVTTPDFLETAVVRVCACDQTVCMNVTRVVAVKPPFKLVSVNPAYGEVKRRAVVALEFSPPLVDITSYDMNVTTTIQIGDHVCVPHTSTLAACAFMVTPETSGSILIKRTVRTFARAHAHAVNNTYDTGYTFTALVPPRVDSVVPTTFAAGRGAHEFVFTGDGLTTNTTISIGGVACPLVFITTHTVTCTLTTLPTSPLDGGSVVTIPAVDGSVFSVIRPFPGIFPMPAISAVSPTTLSTDRPTTLRVTGAWFAADSAALQNTTFVLTSTEVNSSSEVLCRTPHFESQSAFTCVADPTPVRFSGVTFTAPRDRTVAFAVPFSYSPISASFAPSVFSWRKTVNLTLNISTGSATTIIRSSRNITCIGHVCVLHDTKLLASGGEIPVWVETTNGVWASRVSILTMDPPPRVQRVLPDSLPLEGGEIAILGGGFGRTAPHISLDNVNCTDITFVSAGELTCTVPPYVIGMPLGIEQLEILLLYGNVTAHLTNPVVYELPTIQEVSPARLQHAVFQNNRTVQLSGAALAQRYTRFTVGGAPCVVVNASASVVFCEVDTAALTFGQDTVGVTTNAIVGAVDISAQFRVVDAPFVDRLTPRRGTNGTRVTLAGSGFGAAAEDVVAVTFGDVPATFTVINEYTIDAVIPPGLAALGPDGDGFNLPIKVIVVGGLASSSSATFDFNAWPVPSPHACTNVAGTRTRGIPNVVSLAWDLRDSGALRQFPPTTFHVQVWQYDAGGVMQNTNNITLVPAQLTTTPMSTQDGVRYSTALQGQSRVPLLFRVAVETEGGITVDINPSPSGSWTATVYEACSADTYLQTEQALRRDWTCAPCPPGGSCRGGNYSGMVPRGGFFEVPWDTSGTLFIQCTHPEACRGDTPADAGNTTLALERVRGEYGCERGYTGTMCFRCAEGFTSQGRDGVCSECAAERARSWATVVVGIVVIALVFVALVRSALSTVQDGVRVHRVYVATTKLLLTHMQIVAISAQFDLAWPAALSEMFSTMNIASAMNEAMSSPDCVVRTAYSPFMLRAYATLAAPIIVFAAIYVFGLLRPRVLTQNVRFVAALVVAVVSHMSLSKAALKLLTCRALAGDAAQRMLLAADLNVECADVETAGTRLGVGVGGVLLYALGVPFVCGVLLYRSRGRNDRLEFLQVGYKAEFYYWEVVVMLRKVFMAGVAVVLGPASVTTQAFFAQFVLFMFLLLHQAVHPYELKLLNWAENGSLVVSVLTLVGGLLLSAPTTSETLRVGTTISLFALNCAFILACVWLIVRDMARNARATMERRGLRMNVSVRSLLMLKTHNKTRKTDDTGNAGDADDAVPTPPQQPQPHSIYPPRRRTYDPGHVVGAIGSSSAIGVTHNPLHQV